MTTTYKRILFNTNPTTKIVTLILNRPKQKNALDSLMCTELSSALRELSSGPNNNNNNNINNNNNCKGIIITGSGDYYSSGNDLSNFAQFMHPKKMAKLIRNNCEDFVNSFINCNKPIICAVNGPAIGILVTTMGLCDYRICLNNSTFHTPFKQLGQSPEGCSSYTFKLLMGEEFANKMLYDGVKMSAKECLEAGFINEIVDDNNNNNNNLNNNNLNNNNNNNLKLLLERAEAVALKTKRMTIEKPELINILKDVNKNECDILEEKMLSPECFEALAKYLSSRGKTAPAVVLRGMNNTRFLWDR